MATVYRGTIVPASIWGTASDEQVVELARKGQAAGPMQGTLEAAVLTTKLVHYDKSKTDVCCACCCAPRHGPANSGDMTYLMVLTSEEIAVFNVRNNGAVSLQMGMEFGLGGQEVHPGKLADGIFLKTNAGGFIHIHVNKPRMTRGTQHDTTPVGVFGWVGFTGTEGAMKNHQFDDAQGQEIVRALTQHIEKLTPAVVAAATAVAVPIVADMSRGAEPVTAKSAT